MTVPALRTTIRPVTDEDVTGNEPWYPEAAAGVNGIPQPADPMNLRCRLEEARASGSGDLLAILRAGDPEPIGLLEYRLDHPAAGWLTIGFIGLVARLRGRGHGAEAVRLLMEQHRIGACLAEVAPANGLGLYFWLRLGFRPARPNEIFWRAPEDGGTMAMVRYI